MGGSTGTMMTMNGFKGLRFSHLTFASLLAIAACGLTSEVRAQEEGEFFKNALGKMGFIPEDKPPIDYRERAPLVIPKGAALPPPVEGGYGERRMSNWPDDPDVRAERERAEAAVRPRTQTDEWRANQGDARLPAEKLKAKRSAGRDPNDRSPVNAPAKDMNSAGWMSPDQLKEAGSNYRNNETAPGEEPTRNTLTDPPTGYRKAAGGGKIVPTYDPPDTMDPSSPYYMEHMRRKQNQ
ncbi:hypothetical protein WJT86_02960 [Microvirga sp. W0021]|uniref:Uncharacterized protein n=1 Tax=Hohaiivirga grylli TaxID=3133970 RepID=A0ABV0BKG0_9HYPH